MYPIIHDRSGSTCDRGYFSVRSLEECRGHALHTDWSDGPNRLLSLGYTQTDIERVETAAWAAADEGGPLKNQRFSEATGLRRGCSALSLATRVSLSGQRWPDRPNSLMIRSRVKGRGPVIEILSVVSWSIPWPLRPRCSAVDELSDLHHH